jgi:hypothetical protein
MESKKHSVCEAGETDDTNVYVVNGLSTKQKRCMEQRLPYGKAGRSETHEMISDIPLTYNTAAEAREYRFALVGRPLRQSSLGHVLCKDLAQMIADWTVPTYEHFPHQGVVTTKQEYYHPGEFRMSHDGFWMMLSEFDSDSQRDIIVVVDAMTGERKHEITHY